LIFGVGLAVSGMTDTAVVLGFLDVFGNWIPNLAFVMGGAVCVTLITFSLVLRRKKPLLSAKFSPPTKKALDGKLLGGAAIFGIGWGIYGYCPGPAIAALLYLDWKTAVFVTAMLIGMALANRFTTT
jgi:hypothetical protein